MTAARRRYVEVKLESLNPQTEVWRLEIPYGPADQVPDYEDRSRRFITWASNSSSFSVVVTNGTSLTIPVSGPDGSTQNR